MTDEPFMTKLAELFAANENRRSTGSARVASAVSSMRLRPSIWNGFFNSGRSRNCSGRPCSP